MGHDDSTHLGPEPLGPGEQRLAGALRGALDAGRPSADLLGGVQRRAARRHRRRVAGGAAGTALAVAGVLVLVPLGGLPGLTGDGPDTGPAAPGPSPTATATARLSADSLLTARLVSPLVPGEVQQSAAPEPRPPSAPLTGGLCGDAPLDGVTAPAEGWSGQWRQPEDAAAGVTLPSAVSEVVLRWDEQPSAPDGASESAAAYIDATAASPATCADLATFEPDETGSGERFVASGSPEGTDGWTVRALQADGALLVDLTVTVQAPRQEAVDAAGRLLDVALAQARGEAPEPAPAPEPEPEPEPSGTATEPDDAGGGGDLLTGTQLDGLVPAGLPFVQADDLAGQTWEPNVCQLDEADGAVAPVDTGSLRYYGAFSEGGDTTTGSLSVDVRAWPSSPGTAEAVFDELRAEGRACTAVPLEERPVSDGFEGAAQTTSHFVHRASDGAYVLDTVAWSQDVAVHLHWSTPDPDLDPLVATSDQLVADIIARSPAAGEA